MGKKKVLITGITGFTGSHLAEYLLKKGYVVDGTIRGRCRQTEFIDNVKDKLNLLECDLTDINSVFTTLEESQPDVIFHLAAQSFVPTSWRAPQETFNTNALGTLNLLEAVRKTSIDPVVQIAGSSEESGMVYPDECPIEETNPLRPLSPYAVSKVAQDLLGYQYFKSYGIKVIRTRCFNIIGPRSGRKIVSAKFARQVVDIENGRRKKLMVGNLEAVRDFVDVRDVVRAYEIATKECRYGDVYNISTGVGHSIKEILDILRELSHKDIPIEVDKNMLRPSDVLLLVGNSNKFRNNTGWKPEYKFKQSMKSVLLYWREKNET